MTDDIDAISKRTLLCGVRCLVESCGSSKEAENKNDNERPYRPAEYSR